MFATKLLFQSTLPLRGVTEFFNEWNSYNKFQSTLPLRGVTLSQNILLKNRDMISIHTPLAGSDSESKHPPKKQGYDFNPHSPCGE